MRAMKDSGVEWVRRIPSEWETKRLKYIAECNTDVLSENTDEDEQIKYIDIGSVTYEKGIEQIQEFRFSDSPSRARRIIKAGDTIISTVRTYLKAIAYIDQMYDGYICSTGFAVLRVKSKCNPKFLYYALCAEWFISMVEAYSTGISYPAITSTALCSLPVIMPPSREQQRIADFLDAKCAQIDAIIEKQRQVIEKLKAYKRSVITEAVTKGLNPAVPMKDSGIDWIGKIPEHWKVVRIKTYAKLKTGTTPSTATPEYFDGDYDWYTPSDFGDVLTLANASRKLNQCAIEQGMVPEFDEGSVLLVAIGATLGKTGYANKKCSSNQQITAMTPNQELLGKFLGYYFKAMSNVIRDYALYTTLPIINNQTLGAFRYALPPMREQQSIAIHLDKICERIENYIRKKDEVIDELTDYKKSLICETVTGKMEV